MSVERSQASIQRGKTAGYVVRVSTENGSASDVSVTLTAKPASEKPTFSSGCAKGNGSASCAIASVTATAPVTLDAQVPVASNATSVTSVTLTATATIKTTAKWTPPAAAETVTVTAASPKASGTASASSAKSSGTSAGPLSLVAGTTLPLGPYPNLNGAGLLITGSKSSLVGAGNAAQLFPEISPAATPSPGPDPGGSTTAGRNADPISETSAMPMGKPGLSAQAAGLIALAVAFLLTVTRLSVRRRLRSKKQGS